MRDAHVGRWLSRKALDRATGVRTRWRRPPISPERPSPGGLDIVHLAFEDHRRPGSGGGGIRTHEIDRRLAARHRVTVVTTRYPGARVRIEDGVRYVPLGLNLGYFGSVITYHLGIPLFLAFRRPDLVVEDFAAPVSSTLVPLWTRSPTIAVVQWLFARETSRRYHFPFFVFEELGLRLHRRFIAVSGYIAGRVLDANPHASVDTVYAGVTRPAPTPAVPYDPRLLLYLGRIQMEAKGLDLLLRSLAALSDLPHVRLAIAGDGPDRPKVENLVQAHGLGARVEFVGRVDGAAKWELLRRATALVVPSRFETFGMVAAEALCAGTPVIGFDIPALREVVGPDAGILVPPFDTDALADALRVVLTDGSRRMGMGRAARGQVERFNWDEAARAHERAYLAAARPSSMTPKNPSPSVAGGHRRRPHTAGVAP